MRKMRTHVKQTESPKNWRGKRLIERGGKRRRANHQLRRKNRVLVTGRGEGESLADPNLVGWKEGILACKNSEKGGKRLPGECNLRK